YSGGMKNVVQRRVARIPAWAQPLLQAAAVAGRQIDPHVLRQVDGLIDIDRWLQICADASVLDFQQSNWRFSHDKLREGVLSQLNVDLQRELHKRVAEATERAYPDAAEQAAALTNHWEVAGNLEKARHYAAIAGEQALARGAYEEAIRFLES